ncbi:unnamed protein product, partial [Mesorhabditis spiculigera]
MRWVAGLLALVLACSASTIRFTAVPRSVQLPEQGSILSSEIPTLNEQLLGLSTKPVSTLPVTTSLFAPTRALAIVNVADLDLINAKGPSYSVEVDGYNYESLEQALALTFGADRESVQINKDGATGSQMAQEITSAKVDDAQVKTKSEPLRDELLEVYKLVAALKSQGAKLTKSNSPDIYQITITGLSNLVDSADRNAAIVEVQNAVKALTDAMVEVYGGQAVVEVIANSTPIQEKSSASAHNIVKRAVGDDPKEKDPFTLLRQQYNVSVAVSSDYAAIFAIFAGISIFLALFVLYIAVGIWNMDPGRDSIIYRMTTTRMKKD